MDFGAPPQMWHQYYKERRILDFFIVSRSKDEKNYRFWQRNRDFFKTAVAFFLQWYVCGLYSLVIRVSEHLGLVLCQIHVQPSF